MPCFSATLSMPLSEAAALDQLGYNGFVGAAYVPSGATPDSLGRLEAARRQGRARA